MNVNVNNMYGDISCARRDYPCNRGVYPNCLAISQLPASIGKNPNNLNKGMFENMLNNAMAENQSMMELLGNNFEGIVTASNIDIENYSIEIEDNDETQNHICYENLYGIADICFFRPNAVIEEVAAENKALNVDYNVIDAQLLPNGNDSILQEKQEAVFAFQTNMEENLMSVNEVHSEPRIGGDIERTIEAQSMKTAIELSKKQKNEFSHAEMPTTDTTLAKNKITISDGSTEIKSQILSQVKDKIIIMTENNHDSNGIKTITMQLRPQALGKVDIKMSYDNDNLTVEIKALNEETQKVLSSNINELRELLSKTSEADVKIIVKPYELKHQNILNFQDSLQGNEQNFYQNNEQNHQGRHRSKYYYDNNIKTKEEEVFSELIDLNYSKIKEGIYGN